LKANNNHKGTQTKATTAYKRTRSNHKKVTKSEHPLEQLSYFLADAVQITLLPDEEMVPGNPQHWQNDPEMAYSQLPIYHLL
jgi:hypothetical protein